MVGNSVAYPEGFPEHIHNSFSPFMVLATSYMVIMSCEYVQETPLDTPLVTTCDNFGISAVVLDAILNGSNALLGC